MPAHTYDETTRHDFIRFEGHSHFITMLDEARLGVLDVSADSYTKGHSVNVNISDTARIDLLRVTNLDLNLEATDTGRARMIQHSGGLADIQTSNKYVAFIETWRSDTVIETGGTVGFMSLGSDTGEYSHKITTHGYLNTLSVGNDKAILKIGGDTGRVTLDSANDMVTIQSGGGAQFINTAGGNDKVVAKGYLEYLDTGDGNDQVLVHSHVDQLHLGKGNDKIKLLGTEGSYASLRGGDGNDTVDGRKAKAAITVGAEEAEYNASRSIETILGSKFGDFLAGGRTTKLIKGGKGADQILGGVGDNTIDGGRGNDSLFGGNYRGDEGADVFVFRGGDGNDTIYDFNRTFDKIQIIGKGASFGRITTSKSDGDLIVKYKLIHEIGGSIKLVGHADTELAESDFLF